MSWNQRLLFLQLWNLFSKLFWHSTSCAFSYDFRINLSIFNPSKNDFWDFYWIVLKLKINLTHEQGMYLLLFRSSLIFTSFVRFTPKYFLFWCYGKWYYFIISISNCSLLVHINTIDFCRLISYLATLLKTYYQFWLLCKFHYIYIIMSSADKDSFYFFLFRCLLPFSLLLEWLNRLELPVQCWLEVAISEILVFLNLGGKHSVFYH